ncbi:MAG: hypothetical protein DRQ39_06125 [Gammaproteobacteria bacterium]|nr:MAG: hypothetical protein DRQ39_06125 [Gammaproteobacteria bacterium]
MSSGPILVGKFKTAVIDTALEIGNINWPRTFGHGEGYCIPIAVFAAAFLTARGFEARPAEAAARFDDPADAGYALVGDRDAPPEAFCGHLVVWVPARKAVIDFSLQTQESRILRNLGAPPVLTGTVDHTTDKYWFDGPLGRGRATYELLPKRRGWKARDWPFEFIRSEARRAATRSDR